MKVKYIFFLVKTTKECKICHKASKDLVVTGPQVLTVEPKGNTKKDMKYFFRKPFLHKFAISVEIRFPCVCFSLPFIPLFFFWDRFFIFGQGSHLEHI